MKKATKILALLLALVMCMSLVACGQAEAPAEAPAETPADAPAETPADAPVDDTVYEIRISSAQAPENDLTVTLQMFADLMAERSDGRVQITVYPSGILGDELTTTEMVQQGQLEMTMTSAGIMENYFPEFAVVTFPGVFKNSAHFIAASRGDWGASLNAASEKQNLTILGYVCNGFMFFGTTGKPIYGLEDMNGMNIRTIESETSIAMLSGWGCNPVPMAFSEVPTSLQLGAIDGCFLNPMVFISTGIVDIMEYYTADWPVGIGLCPIIINTEYFNSLPDDIKTMMRECWAEAEEDGWRRTDESLASNIKILEERGVEIIHSTEEQMAEVDRVNQEEIWPALVDKGLSTWEVLDTIASYIP